MPQKLLEDGFKWVEDTSQFNKDFIETTNKIAMKDILKFMFKILKNCMTFIMIYPFCLKDRKLKKLKNL